MLKSVYQHTLAQSFSVSGIGVHSGAPVTLTARPALPGSGISFCRTDITDKNNIIPARYERVTDTRLCTVITNDAGVSVSTIEHVMAALAATGIDNAVIDVNGPEMPIMDGSSLPFIKAIETAGTQRQARTRRVLLIKKTVSFRDGDKEVIFTPADGQFFGFEIAFDNPVIGRQKYLHEFRQDAFKRDIAPARTFGFAHEADALKKMGLARGGSLDNAIIIDGDRVLNPGGLRFKNEFVRHKVLDAVGDLYLAGGQLMGHYHGVKAGHAINNKALHALFADPAAYAWVELNQMPETATGAVRAGSLAAAGVY
jgi:UDP-3-O-[3-hydroxymyristoyl] N-acetylglucosamine deacetylase